MPDIERELRAEVNHYLHVARANHYTLYALYVVGVAASIAATVFALLGVSGPKLAIVTAVPGLLLIVNNTLKIPERAQWHYDKRRRLVALLRLLDTGVKDAAAVAVSWNAIDEEMDKTWPAFGTLPKLTGSGNASGPAN